jgi:hypothetical protein
MSTVPAAWAGATALIEVADTTEKVVAGVPPNVTDVAPVNSVPVTSTGLPPAMVPDVGVTLVTVGAL